MLKINRHRLVDRSVDMLHSLQLLLHSTAVTSKGRTKPGLSLPLTMALPFFIVSED